MSIHKLLQDLGGDVEKTAKLKQNPDAVLGEYNLPSEHVDAVKKSLETGDASHVMKHLSQDDKTQYGNVQVNIV